MKLTDNKDLISIIVPIYDVQLYLEECLESIAKQTYVNLQIILVDDGSTDKCPQICDKWVKQDKRFVVIHKANGGLSDARNTGLKFVEGKYVCFVDSDDILDARYIEWMYDAASENNVKMAACDVHCFLEKNKDEFLHNQNLVRIYSSEEVIKQILKGEIVRAVAWNKLYHSDILVDEKFEYGKHHEDEFFTYRIVDKVEKIAYVDAKLYYYRQRPGSIMSSFSIKRLDALEAFIERIKFLKKKYPNLCKREKVTFCTVCISFYRLALETEKIDICEIEKKIKELRGQISFTLKELFSCSVLDCIYIVGSKFPKIFCAILNKVRGKINE